MSSDWPFDDVPPNTAYILNPDYLRSEWVGFYGEEVKKLSLTRKVQIVTAALGGLFTAVFGALLTLGWIDLTQEEFGAVSLIYPAAAAVVIALAQVLSNEDPDA